MKWRQARKILDYYAQPGKGRYWSRRRFRFDGMVGQYHPLRSGDHRVCKAMTLQARKIRRVLRRYCGIF